MVDEKMRSNRFILFMACVVCIYCGAFATTLWSAPVNMAPELPKVSADTFKEVIPITIENEKIFLSASINGQAFRFVFDTGSPTVITQTVVDAMGLTPVGSNPDRRPTGVDANGQNVVMEKVRVDSLQLGAVSFNNVVAFSYNIDHLPIASCVMEGGVIGSDLFPLAVWQLNVQEKTLTIADSIETLGPIKPAKQVPLLQFGYPYAPIFEYKIGRHLRDKLMFDTGAPTTFSLVKPAYQALLDNKKSNRTITGKAVGVGYLGEAASVSSEPIEMLEYSLKKLTIGELKLTKLDGMVRERPPSLLGVSILHRYRVTLDYPNKKAYFSPVDHSYEPAAMAKVRFRMNNGDVEVSYIDYDSATAKQSVQLGQKVLSINGVDVSRVEGAEVCNTVRWLLELKSSQAIKYVVEVDGVARTIIEKI